MIHFGVLPGTTDYYDIFGGSTGTTGFYDIFGGSTGNQNFFFIEVAGCNFESRSWALRFDWG